MNSGGGGIIAVNSDVTINDALIENTAWIGIYLNTSTAVISGTTETTCSNHGFYQDGADRTTIINSTFTIMADGACTLTTRAAAAASR